MLEMNTSPRLRRVKHGYTTGARSLAGRSVTRLARTGVTRVRASIVTDRLAMERAPDVYPCLTRRSEVEFISNIAILLCLTIAGLR